jgi:3-dehydroquinate dehydratase-2
MKVTIINGPNLNLLGKREPQIYGKENFEDYFVQLKKKYPQLKLSYFQSNHEGEIIDHLHAIGFEHKGIIINAGAYSHTSLAIADAIAAISTPAIEVHISNLHQRETFRHHSHLTRSCIGVIAGLGMQSYDLAVAYFLNKLTAETI